MHHNSIAFFAKADGVTVIKTAPVRLRFLP